MPFYSLLNFITSIPNWARRFTAYLLDKFTSEKRTADRIRGLLDKNHEEINALY